MRIIYSENNLWRSFLSTLSNDYEIIEVPPIKKIYRKLIVHMFWTKFYKIKFICNIFNYDIKKSRSPTLVLDIYKPSELWKIAKSVDKETPLYLWFWNPLKPTLKWHNISKTISEIKSMGYAIATFEPTDAINYKLELKPQIGIINSTNEQESPSIDIYFCGKLKGRNTSINNIQLISKEYGFVTKFIIPKSSGDYISYEENLYNVSQSRCILEIVQDNQSGPTLRAIEALLNKKKLITNNKYIKKQDFYNSQNVFIIGCDDYSKLENFIKSPYRPMEDKKFNKYIFSNWIKNW